MIKMLRTCLLAASVIAGSALSTTASAAAYSNVFVFGDSLADSGNGAIFLDGLGMPPGTLRSHAPFVDPVQISTLPFLSNRYSNGPVWVEQFANRLGLSALPSLAGGTNYAFGGANTGPTGSSYPFSLLDQVAAYMTNSGGVASSSALYIVEGGGNDARGIIELAASGGDPTAWITSYAFNVANIVGQLKAAGAQHILLTNVPDISKIPAIQALGPQASAQAQALVAAMNGALGQVLGGLTPGQMQGVHLFDLFGLLSDVHDNPDKYGLMDVTHACGAIAACVANPNGYLFWDGIHPTALGHGLFAQAVANAMGIPEPSSLVLLSLALILLVARRNRHA